MKKIILVLLFLFITKNSYSLSEAKKTVCESCVNTIISDLGFIYLNEKVVDWSNISYGRGWGQVVNAEVYKDENEFEKARRKLANIILGTTPSSEFNGTFKWLNK